MDKEKRKKNRKTNARKEENDNFFTKRQILPFHVTPQIDSQFPKQFR